MSEPANRTAPGRSRRDCVLMGDSGTYRCTSRIAAPTGIAPAMNSQRHERYSTIRPENTIPRPPPTPKTDESNPIPTLTFSGGNSSRMIPKLSGKTAPPVPESARKPISEPMFQANAPPIVPTRKIVSATMRIRSFPYWSPSLPSSGVATEAVSRNAVSTQVAHAGVVLNSSLEGRQRGKDHRLLQGDTRSRPWSGWPGSGCSAGARARSSSRIHSVEHPPGELELDEERCDEPESHHRAPHGFLRVSELREHPFS